ncbi:hypothetical protein ACFYE9_11110 [Rhizobium leguminosarum]|uniref:SLATT domain-containing protein n=2 Tax=Rhizobium leguminosarum TaxID=384 RepID=A0A154IEK6_RHILE|nr:hypothetical protein [Rhizobium leguminosarum]KZA98861.1 hypothetical protein A4A59_25230 [Rhizobium leguminosarum]
MTTINHALLKKFYDEHRDAELNKEYYAMRVSSVKKRLRWLNIFLAVFAGSSAVVGFTLWQQTVFGLPVGALAISALTGIAVIMSIIKPYLGLESDIERLSSIQGVYSALSSLHGDVVKTIVSHQALTDRERTSYDLMRQMRLSVDGKEDKPANAKLQAKAEEIVNRRFPESTRWYP